MNNKGKHFEALAADWLSDRSIRIIAHNYQCRMGEIDLVALDGNNLVFIEVRCRRNPRFSSAAASVDRRKQLKLIRAAQFFLQQNPQWTKMSCRFDVIALQPRQSGADIAVRWIRAAFTL
jgi:putative endonuclease